MRKSRPPGLAAAEAKRTGARERVDILLNTARGEPSASPTRAGSRTSSWTSSRPRRKSGTCCPRNPPSLPGRGWGCAWTDTSMCSKANTETKAGNKGWRRRTRRSTAWPRTDPRGTCLPETRSSPDSWRNCGTLDERRRPSPRRPRLLLPHLDRGRVRNSPAIRHDHVLDALFARRRRVEP